MSHRKYSVPRHGSLAFLPKKRCTHIRGHIRTFPKDNQNEKPHLTAFIGYKAGMTHTVIEMEKPGSVIHAKEIIMPATLIDTPPMKVIGMVGYIDTPKGKRALTTVWAAFIGDEARRRYYKSWYRSKKLAFSKHMKRCAENPKLNNSELARMKKFCSTIRVIAHTQVGKTCAHQKKAHIMEIQINGGSVADKVEFGRKLFEQDVKVSDVFRENEDVDIIGVTKGHGMNGVVRRWGVTRLPRKTRRGNRKVACIGPWHPARVMYSVARAGQMGFFHRTEINKQILRINNGLDAASGSTEFDLTKKPINPMGGFPNYGNLKNDFVMIAGCCVGTKRRCVTLRSPIAPAKTYPTQLKWISTASKVGHGRFQTYKEKKQFYAKK